MSGILDDVTVVELAGIGPGPHAAMMLADQGATVIRVQRPGANREVGNSHTIRGRTIVEADLKNAADLREVRALIDSCDVLIEGFRPGTLERLGLDPTSLTQTNDRLIVARMTGWGQWGPLAAWAGHDINYLAISGALHAIGRADRPVPPLNLVGDFGGGSMLLLSGIVMALYDRERTGHGAIVDVAMIDGISLLSQSILELRSLGMWSDERESNYLDGAAPCYRCYSTADDKFVAVGALEDEFFAELLRLLEVDCSDLGHHLNPIYWDEIEKRLAARFKMRTRDEWSLIFSESDACVTPVLSFGEAAIHPQVISRGNLVESPNGITAGVAPRITRLSASNPLDS